MVVISTWSKGGRIGNESYLTGSEQLSTVIGETVNDIIPPNTNDQAVPIGAFSKADLAGLVMIMDQDGLVRMRGGNPYVIVNIATLGDIELVTRLGGTFTIAGDQTPWIYPGDLFWIHGCTSANNDGLFFVVNATFAAGVTTVEVVRETGVINVGVIEVFDTVEAGAGAACLATKVQSLSRKYNIDAGDDFTNPGPPDMITIGEDLSFLQANDRILVREAATQTNNQIYTVESAVFTAPDTVIMVTEAIGNVEAGNADCTLTLVRQELMCRLLANVPHLWTWPSGIPNPVLEDITTLLVSNSHATADADFQARILKVPV